LNEITANAEHPLRRTLIVCVIVAALLRLGLSAISFGTNDAVTWQKFAVLVVHQGLLQTYRSEYLLNHPPLPVMWAWISFLIGGETWFSFVMKLPAIAGDIAAIFLLRKIWLSRGELRTARLAMIAMTLSPVAILISGYHCNTDNLYAFFSLLAMYLLSDRKQFFLGGLALAAAINVKLIPLLLIPVAFSLCHNWREARSLLGGLAIGVIPFIPLLMVPSVMMRNMFGYVPPISDWGVGYLLHDLHEYPRFTATVVWAINFYRIAGRWLIIFCVLGLSAASWRWRRWNGYQLGAIAFILLLVFAPGFGPQYTVIIVPLLLSLSIARSWVYGILAGAYLFLAYWTLLAALQIPLMSWFPLTGPTLPGAPIGLLAWWVLIESGLSVFRRRLVPLT
jgi:hypothetical protein